MYTITPTLIRRFFSYVRMTEACWLWTAGKFTNGYGQLRVGKRKLKAHRYAYELFYGPIPEGLLVCHHCDVPGCVNPLHLFAGTCGDNIRDAVAKDRWHPPGVSRPGESNPAAKLTAVKVRQIRDAYRPHKITVKMLAAEYEVSDSLVTKILRRIVWRHI